MTPEMRYFRTDSQVTFAQTQVTFPASQILGGDPMRWAILINNDPTQSTLLYFGASIEFNLPSLEIPAGGGPVVITEDVIGDLVKLQVWAATGGPGPLNIGTVTVSYCAYRFQQMEAYVRARLSQFITL